MAAGDRRNAKELAYLAAEDATELCCLLHTETRFNRQRVRRRVNGELNRRLLYLTAGAVFRSMQRLVRFQRWRKLLDTVEAYADGEVTFDLFFTVYEAGDAVDPSRLPAAAVAAAHSTHLLPDDYKVLEGIDYVSDAAGYLGAVAAGVLPKDAPFAGANRVWQEPSFQEAKRRHEMLMCGLIRDIFGNPFRTAPAVAPAWLAWNDGTLPKMAQAVYAGKRFGELPMLADALEEAGCADNTLLTHCRGLGPHVRGCWAVDLLLGRY